MMRLPLAMPTMFRGIGRCVAEDASDHDYEEQDANNAAICEVIINGVPGCDDGLPLIYRTAISNVYEAAVWQFRSTAILEQALVDGAAMFWREAVKRGLT